MSKHSERPASGIYRKDGHSPRNQPFHASSAEDRDSSVSRDQQELDDADIQGDQDDPQEDSQSGGRTQAFTSGRKLSKDDLQDLAKMSSDLVRRTVLSGIDIVRDVGKELPKEATQFLAARREQVLQNVSKDVIQVLINTSMDRLFKTIREHRIEMSFRIVRDAPKVDEASSSGPRERKPRSKATPSE